MKQNEIKFRALIDGKLIHWSNDFFSDSSPVTDYSSEFPDKDDEDILLMQYSGLGGVITAIVDR